MNDPLTHGDNLDPILAQKMFFGSIFEEFYIFSGTWDLFTTTYAILMKRTTDIYLNKFFHLAKFWCLFHREYKNVNK